MLDTGAKLLPWCAVSHDGVLLDVLLDGQRWSLIPSKRRSLRPSPRRTRYAEQAHAGWVKVVWGNGNALRVPAKDRSHGGTLKRCQVERERPKHTACPTGRTAPQHKSAAQSHDRGTSSCTSSCTPSPCLLLKPPALSNFNRNCKSISYLEW